MPRLALLAYFSSYSTATPAPSPAETFLRLGALPITRLARMNSRLLALITLSFALVPLLLGAACTSWAPQPSVMPSDKNAWRQDLRYLAAELPRRHKNAFHTVTRAQFDRAVTELDSAIATLNDDQIVVGLKRITAMIGDGHTSCSSPTTFHFFPLEFYWFGDTLRVTRIAPQYRRALGTRLVQVGDTRVEDAYAAVSKLIPPGEGELWVQRLSPLYFRVPEVLHGLGVLPTAERGRYTFEDDTGTRFSLDVEPATRTAAARSTQLQTEQALWLTAAKAEPLYRQRPNEHLWFTYLKDDQTVFFKFNGYPGYWAFRRFSGQLLDFMDHHPVKRLVIDLRHNGGGNMTQFKWFLLPGLVERRFHEEHAWWPREIKRLRHVYVAIGRETFSAGMLNAVELKNEMAAILVGEPTGGRPNAYSENGKSGRIELPNSHLVVYVSTRYYRLSDEDTLGLMPDRRIDLSWPAFVAGRDPVMEWILAQPAD